MPRGSDKGDPNQSQTREVPKKDAPVKEPKKKLDPSA